MNMRYTPLRTVTAAVLLVASTTISSPSSAQVLDASALKAAIVFNILRFVDFPTGSGDRTLNMCIKRAVPGASSLFSLKGRTVGARSINIRVIDAQDSAGNCDVVYVGAASGIEVARFKQRGVLTIGDGSGFLKTGGTIGLVTTGKQVRFEVNMRSARQYGLGISSQLLRLAARVEQ